MEKKRSSIDWLKKQYYQSEGKLTKYDFEQAKEMEKEQIVEAFFQGVDRESDGHGAMYLSRKDAEQYYNETFGGNNE